MRGEWQAVLRTIICILWNAAIYNCESSPPHWWLNDKCELNSHCKLDPAFGDLCALSHLNRISAHVVGVVIIASFQMRKLVHRDFQRSLTC